MSVVKAPKILLPNSEISLEKWAVIACDQYTSEPEYWQQLSNHVGDEPSTLHMIFPEVYLEDHATERIKAINQTMRQYQRESRFQELDECFILVDRSTHLHPHRLGLVIAIDLEAYDYADHTNALIRATEKTVVSRIPPRVMIRQDATIEIPHVQLLMNDPKRHIIEPIYANKESLKKVYDFELNANGGHVTGYQITNTEPIINQLESLIDENHLQFIVGDGNHSLATAKTCWENVKKNIPAWQRNDHPSRYAMVELINLYDDGLEFEPIHRVVFSVDDAFVDGLKALATGHSDCYLYQHKIGKGPFPITDNAPIAIEKVQHYIDTYLSTHPKSTVDYVHGDDSLIAICKKHPNAIGISLPKIDKNDIFTYVSEHGVLPRKSFSMGEAFEKRYYLESRKIK